MSGGLAGDEASKLASKTIAQTYYEKIFQLEQPPTDEHLKEPLKNAVMQAN